jgi:hypothetical protein
VSLHYYAQINGGRGYTIAWLHIEYADGTASTLVQGLENSEVNFILSTHFYVTGLRRENNCNNISGLPILQIINYKTGIMLEPKNE